MRKALIGLAASALMLPTMALGATANDGWSIEFTSAELYYKGLNLELAADVICPAGVPVEFLIHPTIRQNVHRDTIASSFVNFEAGPWVCDGVTVNHVSSVAYVTDGPAFKNGMAVIDMYVFWNVWPSPSGNPLPDTYEVKLKRAN